MKLHLRLRRLNGKLWRVLTLRPGTEAAFSSNYFHETWHILSDKAGAELLSHLFWGLSYQREPGTLFVLHGEHLKATPFEAERSYPIAIAPSSLTHPDPQAFRELKALLRKPGPPTGTVRLRTCGREAALTTDFSNGGVSDHDRLAREHACELPGHWTSRQWQKERMTLCNGIIYYCAPPAVLRAQSLCLARMQYNLKLPHYMRMDYCYLAEHGWHHGNGEVQIFSRYREMLSESAEARRNVVSADEGDTLPVPLDRVREAIWQETDRIATRRRKDLRAYRRRLRAERRESRK